MALSAISSLRLLHLGAVDGDGEVSGVHAVLVGPQVGARILAGCEAVDRGVVDGQGVGGIVVVAHLDGSLTGGAALAVVEGAVVHHQIGGLLGGFFSELP